jgi:hypothetical protein
MGQNLLEFVLQELKSRSGARTGNLTDIAKAIEPDNWASYYSWLSKVVQGQIPDPGVNKIQRLADYFRNIKRKKIAA